MARTASLPTEVIQEIISHLPKRSLRNVSLVCRTFWEVVTPILYKNVDFATRRVYEDDSLKRQHQLLTAIAGNRQLGTSVQYFGNCSHRRWDNENSDATIVPDVSKDLLQKAAANMTNIRNAVLTNNHLGNYIVANLPLYFQLTNLEAYFINSGTILNPAMTSLRTLTWTVPITYYEKNEILKGYLDFFIGVVETTCPSLVDLDIHFESANDPDPFSQGYRTITTDRLLSLRHFGIRNNSPNSDGPFPLRYYTHIIERYMDVLESLDIPLQSLTWTQGDFAMFFALCDRMPQLKCLKLTEFDAPLEGMALLTRNLEEFHPCIESLSIQQLGCQFSPEIGRLFKNLRCLKYLRIGDDDNGEEAADRLMDYDESLLGFILELPRSLEKLYIEINALNTRCWEDEDLFHLVCDYEEIFSSLRRLHTCDIHGWFEPRDGGDSEEIPERGVFYRRLPHQETVPGILGEKRLDTFRDVCTTRMTNVYQSEAHEISESRDILTLEDNNGEGFEGQDAEKFCGSFKFKINDVYPHYSWPFPEDIMGSYQGFSTRHGRF